MIRDQFTVLPIPDEVIKMLDAMAAKDGITRATNLFEIGNPGDKGFPDEDCVSNGSHRLPSPIEDDESDNEDIEVVKGPAMKSIPPDRRLEGIADVDFEDVDDDEDDRARDIEPDVPIESDLKANEERMNRTVPDPQDDWVRRSARKARQIGLVIETGVVRKRSTAFRLPRMAVTLTTKLTELDCDSARRAIRRELQFRGNHRDTEYAIKMSVRAAMRDRPKEALPVIEAELQQMHDKRV